jgi:hypothetical protein
MLTGREHAQPLELLPDRLAAIPQDSVVSAPKQTYVDTVGSQCPADHTRHVRAGEIAVRLDGKSQEGQPPRCVGWPPCSPPIHAPASGRT